MKKLTIVIPVFNGEKFIKNCVNNLEKSNFNDFEIIIINDGSTDNTLKIIKELLLRYDNIEYINNKKNKGVSYSRNVGIEKSNGKYIGFVDADDYVDNSMFSNMIKVAIKNDADVVVCNYIEIDELTKVKTKSKYRYNKQILLKDECLKNFLTDKISPAIWDKIYKKELIKKVKFNENLQVGEDLLFCLNIFLESKKNAFINEYYYNYIQQNSSVMHNISPKLTQFKDVLNYVKKEKYLNSNFEEEYSYFKLEMITRGIHSISSITNKSNKKTAIKYLKLYCNKIDLNQIIKNKFFSKSIKIEIFVLKTFGINVHLALMPIYKKIRKVLR